MAREKINAAIGECLQRCYRSRDAIAAVADYITELQDSIGWNDVEIHAVELAVLRMLGSMTNGAIYPGDATNWPASDQNHDRKATSLDRAQPSEA